MQKKSKVIEKFLLCEEMDRLLEITDFRQPEKTTYPVGLILLCALVEDAIKDAEAAAVLMMQGQVDKAMNDFNAKKQE